LGCEVRTLKLYHEERMDPIKEALEADVLLFPEVNPRKMMGCPCYMAGNKMFATIVDDAIVITKLGEEDREALMADHDAGPFTHGTKVMSKWMKVPIEKEDDLDVILPYVVKSYEAATKENAADRYARTPLTPRSEGMLIIPNHHSPRGGLA
jgi:TfoX/Sxy family transcriptional regulator of competence genes